MEGRQSQHQQGEVKGMGKQNLCGQQVHMDSQQCETGGSVNVDKAPRHWNLIVPVNHDRACLLLSAERLLYLFWVCGASFESGSYPFHQQHYLWSRPICLTFYKGQWYLEVQPSSIDKLHSQDCLLPLVYFFKTELHQPIEVRERILGASAKPVEFRQSDSRIVGKIRKRSIVKVARRVQCRGRQQPAEWNHSQECSNREAEQILRRAPDNAVIDDEEEQIEVSIEIEGQVEMAAIWRGRGQTAAEGKQEAAEIGDVCIHVAAEVPRDSEVKVEGQVLTQEHPEE